MALFGKKKTAPADDTVVVAPNGISADTATGDALTGDPLTGDGAVAAGEGEVAPVKARKAKPPRAAKSSVKSGTVVGLNIGNAFIKAVEVTSKGGQLSVTGIGVVETPPDSYANGNVLNVSALSNALRALWKAAGFHTKATVLSVAGTGSLVVRVIEVPRMTDGELQDNMRVDADRYIPFPPSEVIMDFKALRDLPSDPDAANMEVLLAAAQREIIDLHVGVVQKAKLDPKAIDVEPIALARAIQLETRAAGELLPGQLVDYDDVSAILNIGETGTEISILRGDIVVFTRSVPNGGGNLTDAIAEAMGLPRGAAERLKIDEGDALPPAGYDDGLDAGDEDFGFGDFGDVTPDTAAAAGAGAAVTLDKAPQATQTGQAAAPASDDPFDLDFFDQGGNQAQPGAGHGQKEGDPSPDEAASEGGINFAFDKLDDDLTPSHASDTPPAPPVQAAPEPPPPAPAPSMEDFDLPDAYLPAATVPIAPLETSLGATTPAGNTSAAAAPTADATMPSAFDFSDFDLPAVEGKAAPNAAPAFAPTQKLSAPEDEAIAPAAAPVAAAPSGFGFTNDMAAPDESLDSTITIAPTEAAPPVVIAEPAVAEPAVAATSVVEPVAATSVVAAPAGAAADFDLDDLFASAPAIADTAAAPVADDGGFDMGAMDFGAAAGAGDFDVSGLDVAEEGADFSSFGTGLSQTGATDANTLYAAMQPVLDDLATEVRRSLEFHLGRYPDTTFSRLVLVGGGAKLRNLDAFLNQNLGVPTVIGNPFSGIEVKAPGLPPEFVPTNAPLCAVALGLALRDFIE